MRRAEVDISALRAAFEASGKSPAEVARAMDWFCTNRYGGKARPQTVADGPRVLRQLGCKPAWNGGRPTVRQTCSYERATQLAHAIGVDPVNVGL